MTRPLSMAEREAVVKLRKRGWEVNEIAVKIRVGKRYIQEFLDLSQPEIEQKDMGIVEAYFMFPEDTPAQLAKRTGFKVEQVTQILDERELPYRKIKA
jgi:hypothetical protein